MQCLDVAPNDIVLMTFTNKASKEMRERVTAIVGETKVGQYALAMLISPGRIRFVECLVLCQYSLSQK